MKTVSEKDFKEKMVELIRNGYEYIDQVQCLFFAWVELFDKYDDEDALMEMAECIAASAGGDKEETIEKLLSVLQ